MNCLKGRNGVLALLQMIIGNARSYVVNVVQSDVPGKPLEDFRQLEIGAAFERDPHGIPRLVAYPIDGFELMLDIEQPQSNTPGNQDDGQLNQEICRQTDGPGRTSDDEQDRQVGVKYAHALSLSGPFDRKSVQNEKEQYRPWSEQNERITIKSVSEPLR